MIPQLLEKIIPYKNLIIHDDLMREYYNKLKAADRAYLLTGLACGYYTTDNLLELLSQLVKRSYLEILSDDIMAFTAIPLNEKVYKEFLDKNKYYLSRNKYEIMYSIATWIVEKLPKDKPVDASLLENISLSFMILFLFQDKIEVDDNIVTYLEAVGGADNV